MKNVGNLEKHTTIMKNLIIVPYSVFRHIENVALGKIGFKAVTHQMHNE